MNLKKIGKLFTNNFAGTRPSSYKKIIYLAVVSQRLRNTALERRKVPRRYHGITTHDTVSTLNDSVL